MARSIVSFLSSGYGSNFAAVMEKINKGYIKAVPGILISDKADAMALVKADKFGMHAEWINPKSFDSKKEYEEAMIELLVKHKTDLVVTAGFMRILSPVFVRAFENRIINIHPSLLPSFPGINAQQQALNYGVKFTGCTAHFIDEGTDTGPIIMQAVVPVSASDDVTSLSKKILKEEHRILPESVKLFCDNKISVQGRNVLIKSSKIKFNFK